VIFQTADIVYSAAPTVEEARSFYARLKGRVAALGRQPKAVKILPGVQPVRVVR
jgi:alkanesulfonate monooxygenase SsuD/methylene tetrahydromethanopterin reductase-like flavin-dependent oxidoreductase (luciferase family)